MAACRAHPDREATASCAGCDKALCDECVELNNESGAFCYDCAVSGELERFRERERLHEKKPANGREKSRRFSRLSLVLIAVLSLLIVAQVVVILMLRPKSESSNEMSSAIATQWKRIRSETADAARNRDLCLAGMQTVRDKLESYRGEHGSYPASLAQLEAAGSGTVPACPLTGAPYMYDYLGDNYLLYCPNPDMHGVEAVEATAVSSPELRMVPPGR